MRVISARLFGVCRRRSHLTSCIYERIVKDDSLVTSLFTGTSRGDVDRVRTVVSGARRLFCCLHNNSKVAHKRVLSLNVDRGRLRLLRGSPRRIGTLKSTLGGVQNRLNDHSPFLLLRSRLNGTVRGLHDNSLTNKVRNVKGTIRSFTPTLARFNRDVNTLFNGSSMSGGVGNVASTFNNVNRATTNMKHVVTNSVTNKTVSTTNNVSGLMKTVSDLFNTSCSRCGRVIRGCRRLLNV